MNRDELKSKLTEMDLVLQQQSATMAEMRETLNNLRSIVHPETINYRLSRTCATCEYLSTPDDFTRKCLLAGGPAFSSSSYDAPQSWEYVCDRYRRD